MYFNSELTGGISLTSAVLRQPKSIAFPIASGNCSSEITVLTSLDYPVNKRFSLDENGQVKKQNFQNAFHFNPVTVPVGGICDLAKLIEFCSADNRHILIRALPVNPNARSVRKTNENFMEHPDGTDWAMLDFDDIEVPSTVDPLSIEAIEWVISKLPAEFHNVTFFYQHSGSAGVLSSDGTPLKSGLNAHIFFWLDRRVPGKQLSAYLSLHCMETGFYTLGENRGGNVALSFGVDPAPLRSEVQAHYIAAPTIDAGVNCRITPEKRQGLARKTADSVTLPLLAADVVGSAGALKHRLVNEYKRSHGYETQVALTNIQGKVAVTRYSVAPRQADQPARRGRPFAEAKLSQDGKYLTLYFTDEGSPGSWYVRKDRPQIGIRHGDGDSMPLKELSQGAHDYVRDELGWFSEVPHHHLTLVDGFLPALTGFATAKVSLVLSPTGSGKTTATLDWIQSRIEQRQLVLYTAPTIALVKQMQSDLTQAGLSPAYYEDVWGPSFSRYGVIVSTYDSLPRLLKDVYAGGVPHALILDEIHQGLDRFMRGSKSLENLESALSKSRQSLLLTGTLTDVQRHALVEIAKHALGSLTECDYCCYEFAPFKRNPLEVIPTARFDSDLALLFEDFQDKLAKNEPLPRFVMLLDTSKMEMYRRLVAQYGLTDHAVIVSRPENSAEEIEAARTSVLPMLISSPLFGLGLNFARAPDILWARFDHMEADTSQIIQAVNRANRGRLLSQVRIYGNVHPDACFALPNGFALRAELAERFHAETSVTGYLEEHLQLDRVTYQLLRNSERNSFVALSSLVRDNAIQNFKVVDCASLPEVNKDKAAIVKAARTEARGDYRQAVVDKAARFSRCSPMQALIRLEQLYNERKNNWRCDEPRLERELQNEEAGIFMGSFRILDPAAAQMVKTAKVKRLFGELSPWISSQYARDRHPDWAKVEAEKTDKIVLLLKKLEALTAGQITADDLSAALTRNGRLGEAFQALAGSDLEFQSIGQKVDALKKVRVKVRTLGGSAERDKVGEKGRALLRELLEPLGVTYGKKESRGRQVTDNTKPIVPSSWNLPDMILVLERQAARLRALPSSQKEPIVPTPEDLYFDEQSMPRQICESCIFFHENACCQGRPVDWQSFGNFDASPKCDAFKRIKVELMLH
ncbi:DEAD/DEAH box helicase family protein [Cupriavidus sp. 2TAF22]|uniref:DEAD/DEAH box helicase family protein n=1 Tax=unclassified Cupriavidus TaxID=2640874 RepID=UPI003F8DD2BB